MESYGGLIRAGSEKRRRCGSEQTQRWNTRQKIRGFPAKSAPPDILVL